MPVSYKLFILAKIRSVDPFLYLDLAPACLLTFMDLQKVLKSTIFIETSQWEKSAETRTEVMDAVREWVIQLCWILWMCTACVRIWEKHHRNW